MSGLARGRANLAGGVAIALWSLLSLLTVATGEVPPFQLAAMTFALGGGVGVVSWLWRRPGREVFRQPAAVWAIGVGGLFGYHALYFMALRLAPPAEAGLICYLWPLLIVLFSAALPQERLRPHHLLGALLGLAGTALLFQERGLGFSAQFLPGYAAAFVAAFVWAFYSVLSRVFSRVPSDTIAGFCLATAALSLVGHGLFEETVWPTSGAAWLAIAALGVGPVGVAFYAWDHGVKHGDVTLLGACSYAAPVLSTACLVAAGFAPASPALGLAALLIAVGGLVAAKDVVLRRATQLQATPRSE